MAVFSGSITGGITVYQNSSPVPLIITGYGITSPPPVGVYVFTYNINDDITMTIDSSVSVSNTSIVLAPTNVIGTFVYNLLTVGDFGSYTSVSSSTTVTVVAAPTPASTDQTIVCDFSEVVIDSVCGVNTTSIINPTTLNLKLSTPQGVIVDVPFTYMTYQVGVILDNKGISRAYILNVTLPTTFSISILGLPIGNYVNLKLELYYNGVGTKVYNDYTNIFKLFALSSNFNINLTYLASTSPSCSFITYSDPNSDTVYVYYTGGNFTSIEYSINGIIVSTLPNFLLYNGSRK